MAAVVAGALAAGTAIIPWRPSIAPVERPAADLFSASTIERGRLAAAAGACDVCHVGADGTPFAGGRALETPFGRVYATNITPDAEAGIGAWTYSAFERAMRSGVSRDGHLLYPAHPYTSFVKTGERDLQALYAYLMAQAPSASKAPETRLRFPFGVRPLMAGWNALFLSTGPAIADPAKSAVWNRGAELVEGLGHCSACHSPRNALGAEKTGEGHLAGGHADGWDAPALNALSVAPVAWTQGAFYDYLRTGRSAEHGAASGPMTHVVDSFRGLPDADILAMATYLGSLSAARATPAAEPERVIAASDAAATSAATAEPIGARIFEGACASCHGGDGDPTPLALHTSLHAAEPTNAIQAIRHGVPARAGVVGEAEAMPAFAGALDDDATASLLRFLRARFAPQQTPWHDIGVAVRSGK